MAVVGEEDVIEVLTVSQSENQIDYPLHDRGQGRSCVPLVSSQLLDPEPSPMPRELDVPSDIQRGSIPLPSTATSLFQLTSSTYHS